MHQFVICSSFRLQSPRMLILLLGSLCLALPVFAQPLPDAGSLLNEQQRQQQRLPDRLPSGDSPSERPALRSVSGEKVVLRAVHFTGSARLVSEAELQTIVADSIGTELDFSGMEQLAARATEFLRKKGFFLARAYLPQQDVTDGVLEITILEGNLDGKSGKGKAFVIVPDVKQGLRINEAILAGIAQRSLSAGSVAKERDIERAVLLMNDLPGISAKARLEPGTELGSTRVAIDAQEGALFGGSGSVNNHGNRDTGLAQINLAGQFNDPLKIGDQLAANYTHSTGLDLERLGYTLPLGSQGAKLGGSWTRLDYRIIRGVGQTAGLAGNSDTGNLTLSYPFMRSRAVNVYGALGYTGKSLKNTSSVATLSDKRLNSWSATLSGDALDSLGGGGLNAWNATITQGNADLSRVAADAAADLAGYNTQGSFNKLNFSTGRLQKVADSFTFYANLSAQSAGSNLDSSEKFILGGPSGVRAYSGSEGLGDSGYLANMELRYDVPSVTSLGQLQVIGFYDYGHIVQHTETRGIPIPTATGLNRYSISGVGFGVNLSKTRSHSIQASWAQKIGSNPGRTVAGLDADGLNSKSRFWLQATAWF